MCYYRFSNKVADGKRRIKKEKCCYMSFNYMYILIYMCVCVCVHKRGSRHYYILVNHYHFLFLHIFFNFIRNYFFYVYNIFFGIFISFIKSIIFRVPLKFIVLDFHYLLRLVWSRKKFGVQEKFLMALLMS